MRDLLTADDVRAVAPGGEIRVSAGAVVTPWAREIASTRGVRIVVGSSQPAPVAVALGADHGGFALKEKVKAHLGRLGHQFHDFGTYSTDPVDYPDLAVAVASAVQSGRARFGILVDGAGIGSAIAANKLRGIRAAVCVDAAAARNAREHNDANVLSVGSSWVDEARMQEIVEAFISGECTEPRHLRRVGKISRLEEDSFK
jgi:ribose 5-phosphate isomerase B